jgi:hypothetical protein
MWSEIVVSLGILCGYSILNAVVLTGLWYILSVGGLPVRLFRDVFVKTVLSVGIVWGLSFLIMRMFCWTAAFMECLNCVCLVMPGSSLSHMSLAGAILFLSAVLFTQLTLIAIPERLSRVLFVLSVIASNVVAGLLILGLDAVLM